MTTAGAKRQTLTPLLTADEVADLLSISPKTIYAWAESGRLPCVRLGGRVRFDPGDLTRWIAARKEGGRSA